MFHIFFSKLQGAFIAGYNTLASRAAVTRKAKESDEFLRAHRRHLLLNFSYLQELSAFIAI